jgi:predicted transcriptional regulator
MRIKWTDAQWRHALEMRAAGKGIAEIAREVGRKRQHVESKMRGIDRELAAVELADLERKARRR